MQSKIMLILSGVAAIILALILNPMKFPKDELGKVIKIPEIRTKTVYVNVPGKTVVNTKIQERIKIIRDSFEIIRDDTSLITKVRASNLLASAAKEVDKLQAENAALIEDRNTVVDALAEATNQLWQTKLDTPAAPKKLKHGVGASYMILGGSKPIYQLTYEKPLTKNLSVEIGGLWNGKPGVSAGFKVRF